MSGKIIDRRKQWDTLKKQIKDLKKNPYTAIGVLGEESGGSDFGLVEYATANEFGTTKNGGHVPERSFIRSTVDENERKLFKFMENMKVKILLNRIKANKALSLAGVMIQGLIQKKITDLKSPPNAPSTIKSKGSNNPLIDTGRMRQSIKWQLRKGNE